MYKQILKPPLKIQLSPDCAKVKTNSELLAKKLSVNDGHSKSVKLIYFFEYPYLV